MYRNLSKRVEVVAPVLAQESKEKLWEILDICLRDSRQAWVLGQDGTYSQLQPGDAAEGPDSVGTHQMLMQLARRRSEIGN
jgi:polyphosphate kinase